MRVSFSMIYDQSVRHMNTRLSEIMRANEQTASQKRINRPSDDPAGAAQCLDLRTSLSRLEEYAAAMDTADGWLSEADAQLRLASDVLTRVQELCEQAATGTYSDEQRRAIASEARQLMEELVAMANTEYAGDSIFAGTRTDANAYAMALGATVADGEGGSLEVASMSGEAESSVYVEFLDDGAVGTDALRYRFSADSGASWQERTLAVGDTALDCGGIAVELAAGSTVIASDAPDEPGTGQGSRIWLRPAAIYQGNGVDQDGAQPGNSELRIPIGDGSSVCVSSVGAEIFGGLVKDGSGELVPADPADANLLETVGELVGYLETNDLDGVGGCLDGLTAAHQRLSVALGAIGGRENRLEFARAGNQTLQDAATAHISSIEDADLTQLSVDLAKAQYAYEAVLQSSSTIMNLSLLDYL